jgi:type II secretory pathway component PulF
VVCLLVVVVLPVFCLDGLLGIIEQNTDTVPFLTQALLAVNNFLGQPLLWLVLTAIMIIVSTKRNHLVRAIRERHILWNLLPLFGPLNRLRHLSSALVFSNSLALQLEVGLTPLNALPLAAGTTGDPAWEKLGLSARDRLVEGETFSDAFGKPEFLDPIFVSILAVGQESGKLPRLLKSYVKMCQEELEYRIEQLLALMEPLLLLLMGFVFGIIMLATLQPMLNLVRNL